MWVRDFRWHVEKKKQLEASRDEPAMNFIANL